MKQFISLIVALIIIVPSCKKASTTVVPGLATIATLDASDIASTTVASGGNCTSDGGARITERGICYNTTANPTTANIKIVSRSGTGSFNSIMSGLAENTIYYVRAYATNSAGTSYGQAVEFTTKFETVTIGTQVWMKENLNVST